MSEKPKSITQAHLLKLARILEDLDRFGPSQRAQAIQDCVDLAPYVGKVLTALLRGLNDSDDLVRFKAIEGLSRVFPDAGAALARLVEPVESEDPKVRLAAIAQVITILPQMLAPSSGVTPHLSAAAIGHPVPFMEDPMQYAGRWVAWTNDRQRVLAVADSYGDVVKQAIRKGESDPYVKKMPGVSAERARAPFVMLADESVNIVDDVNELLPNAQVWLDTPNSSLGGEKPRDLIGTEMEREVRFLLRGIKDGITT